MVSLIFVNGHLKAARPLPVLYRKPGMPRVWFWRISSVESLLPVRFTLSAVIVYMFCAESFIAKTKNKMEMK
jgi:hypothetical protein